MSRMKIDIVKGVINATCARNHLCLILLLLESIFYILFCNLIELSDVIGEMRIRLGFCKRVTVKNIFVI